MQSPNLTVWYSFPLKYSVSDVDPNDKLSRDFWVSKLGDNLGMIWVRKTRKIVFCGRSEFSLPSMTVADVFRLNPHKSSRLCHGQVQIQHRLWVISNVQFWDLTCPIQSQITYGNVNLGTSIGSNWPLNENTGTITLKLTEKAEAILIDFSWTWT